MEIDPSASAAEQYAYRLRLHRERAELTQDDVARKCIISVKMIGHFENCRRIPTLEVSKGLDRLFGLDRYFEELHPHVVREAALTPAFRSYAEEEQRADSVRMFEPLLVPGLVQTEAYATEVLRVGQPDDRLVRSVALRLARQDILERDDPPFLMIVMKESVLREVVGGREVMREQLTHLLDMARRPNISIQVTPSGAPVYVSGGFMLLGYTESADLVYVDGAGGHGQLIGDSRQVHSLAVRFDQIQGVALPVSESETLIRSIMEQM
ncbi:helix-turn-helix domain-containing protein [Actinoallomurus rhizosphaericola]|uniref:helix-turn-helix domain-containing protein n=1 Tax=Actinoallomurus rhizosphaericola TaxID=2952536 RepID=UPI0020915C41|nr:helix-turn-helix transcriptional regulator [Actinoallomurus rhizosphaericola]MCO5993737.1 helix-turn-helix transcriptional regulator [Actinoallomurus rhizosphaericola]